MSPRSAISDARVRALNEAPIRIEGRYVLYWMVAQRRTRWNFALERAVDHSVSLGKPLLVFEALRCGYRWASDRFHRFVIAGMADNRRRCREAGVGYWPYVESHPGEGRELLATLAASAAVVITDDFPCFFIPDMIQGASERLAVRLEAVDSNGLLPVAEGGRAFPTAHSFRRFLQKSLPEHLEDWPQEAPLRRLHRFRPVAPGRDVTSRWSAVAARDLDDPSALLARLPIDHEVSVVPDEGGSQRAETRLKRFLSSRLLGYGDRNAPDCEVTSALSPYLHFGHISSHEVVAKVLSSEEWSLENLSLDTSGKRRGWWGLSEAAEGFLDQIVTWRELGYNGCRYLPGYDCYESLPDWAQKTLAEHEDDPREPSFDLATFEAARTHDSLWNAAQNQLLREGRIHNYLRMLWGKKILHWSPEPREALAVMIELNNKYALDGRNPNSYSGIFWTLGRYDRAWGPERPVFGKVRYMTSENTARKYPVKAYIRRYGLDEKLMR